MTFPPIETFALVSCAAFITIALSEVSDVSIAFEIVKSPVFVAMSIVPVLVIPSMVSASLST